MAPAARRGCAAGPCSDSSACPPALLAALSLVCGAAGALLPAKLRRRRAGCGTRDSHRFWLNTEPCGLLCATLSWAIVLYCESVVLRLTLGGWYAAARGAGAVHAVIFSALALASHARAMLSNPGATPNNSKPTTPAGWLRTCTKCDNHKPARAHHCSICGRCIIKMGAWRAGVWRGRGLARNVTRRRHRGLHPRTRAAHTLPATHASPRVPPAARQTTTARG